MSEQWVEHVKAVATLAKPPMCIDGEVRCTRCTLPLTGMHPALNRHDKECYWCGNDALTLVGEQLRAWYRVPEPLPPKEPDKQAEYSFLRCYQSPAQPLPAPISGGPTYTFSCPKHGIVTSDVPWCLACQSAALAKQEPEKLDRTDRIVGLIIRLSSSVVVAVIVARLITWLVI